MTLGETLQNERYMRIVLGLLAVRKAGHLFAVWCDGGIICTQRDMWSDRERITWDEAEELIALHGLPRKPATSVMITESGVTQTTQR